MMHSSCLQDFEKGREEGLGLTRRLGAQVLTASASSLRKTIKNQKKKKKKNL